MTVATIDTQELSTLADCEAVIEAGITRVVQGTREVCVALRRIQEASLYPQGQTFADYGRERWGLAERRLYELAHLGMIFTCTIVQDKIINVGQARELVPIVNEPDKIKAIVDRAESESGKITAKTLKEARVIIESDMTVSDPASRPKRDTAKEFQKSDAENTRIFRRNMRDLTSGLDSLYKIQHTSDQQKEVADLLRKYADAIERKK